MIQSTYANFTVLLRLQYIYKNLVPTFSVQIPHAGKWESGLSWHSQLLIWKLFKYKRKQNLFSSRRRLVKRHKKSRIVISTSKALKYLPSLAYLLITIVGFSRHSIRVCAIIVTEEICISSLEASIVIPRILSRNFPFPWYGKILEMLAFVAENVSRTQLRVTEYRAIWRGMRG